MLNADFFLCVGPNREDSLLFDILMVILIEKKRNSDVCACC